METGTEHRRARLTRGIRLLLVFALLPLTACEYFFPSDPGPSGPLAVQYQNAQLHAVLPDCAPAPVEAQLRTVSNDRKIWSGDIPVDSSASTFPFTYDAWDSTAGTIPTALADLNRMEVTLVDDDYRAWTITLTDSALLLQTGADTGLVLTALGLTQEAAFREAACT